MIEYEWRNTKTDEVRITSSPDTPPTKAKHWVRRFSFGIGPVPGGGRSPARPSPKR